MTETTHATPPRGAVLTPCCRVTVLELPLTDRLTNDPARVTCGRTATMSPAPNPKHEADEEIFRDRPSNASNRPFVGVSAELYEVLCRVFVEARPFPPGDPIPRYAQLDVWMALYGSDRSNEYHPFREQHGFAETWARLMVGIRLVVEGCPAIGPSDQHCIGRAFWHEVHADAIGSTWRDYAGKAPGLTQEQAQAAGTRNGVTS